MIVLYHNCLVVSSTFYNFFEKVLFTVLRIFLWIPEPLFELADRLSLSTRLSYYSQGSLSIAFLKIFLFTRLQKFANPHKYRLFGMKKSFFVKNYFLLKRKNKGCQDQTVCIQSVRRTAVCTYIHSVIHLNI